MKLFDKIKNMVKPPRQHVKCISNMGGFKITVGKEYEIISVLDNPDGTFSYEIKDDNDTLKIINACRFTKID